MKRVPREVRDFHALRCKEAARSRQAAATFGRAVRVSVQGGYGHLLTPRVYARAIHRALRELSRGLDTRTGDGWACHVVLSKGPAALGAYLRRNPAWTAAQIAAATQPDP